MKRFNMKCSRCGEEKDTTSFYKDKQKKSGFRPECKSCNNLGINRERRKKYEKKYWDERREERREMILKSHKSNKDHHKIKRQEYLKTEEGIEMYRRQTQTRYARRKNAFVERVDPVGLYSEQGGVCYLCGGSFQFSEMECDHVIPLAKGGLHDKSNLKMACSFCNRSKGAKTLKEVGYQMV